MPRGKRGGDAPEGTEESIESSIDSHVANILSDAEGDEDADRIEVSLDDDDDDQTPGTPGTRDEKKKTKWAEHTAARTEAEERARNAEAQLATERARVAAMEQARQQPAAPTRPQQTPEEFFKAKEDDLRRRRSDIRKTYDRLDKKTITDEDNDRFADQWETLDQEGRELSAQKVHFFASARAAQNRPDPIATAVESHVTMNYPEMVGHAQANNYAAAQLDIARLELEATTGQPVRPSMKMLDEALQKARKRFFPHLAKDSKAPSKTVQSRFSGPPAGPRGNANGNQNGGRRTITMGKHERQMAAARYPNLSPDKANKAWAKAMEKEAEKESS